MHKIDLLKGQGIPPKVTFGNVIIIIITIIVPVLVLAGFLDKYLRNNIEIENIEHNIGSLEQNVTKSQPDMKVTLELQGQRDIYAARLNEVAKCVDTYMQWSPVLIELAQKIPPEIIMTKMEVTTEPIKTNGKQNNDPNKPLSIPIPERKMVMELNGIGTDSFNTIVQNYQKNLKASEILKSELKDLKFYMNTNINEDSLETYYLNFVFQKPKK